MISVNDATHIFKNNLNLSRPKLAHNVVADRDYPPFDRVMMDGIALKFSAYEKGLRNFNIKGIQAAGTKSLLLDFESDCFEVMTGAPLPQGADLVVPYEHLLIENQQAKIVKEFNRPRMDNIHLKGSDCKKGDLVLAQGASMNGPHQGIAASMGVDFSFTPSTKILLISTGDELVDVHEEPLEHQIRRSNVYALERSLRLNGFEDVTLHHLKDDFKTVFDHYQGHAHEFDVMIYSGGVSKGRFDYLPEAWQKAGVKKHFHVVAQRPGKPLWFGTDEQRTTTVIGLPGNPVSSLVCLHRYVIPGKTMYARLTEEVIFKKDLTYFLPVKTEFKDDGVMYATPLKIKNSGEFTALAESDGFIELPADKDIFASGESYKFWPWRNI